MYALVYRSAYRGGWKIKPKMYKTRELAAIDGEKIVAALRGGFRIIYFDWD